MPKRKNPKLSNSLAHEYKKLSGKLKEVHHYFDDLNKELEYDFVLRKLNTEIFHFLISPPLDLGKISKQILLKTIEVIKAQGGSIHIFNEEKNILELAASKSVSKEFLKKSKEIPLGNGPIGKTAFFKKSLILKQEELDPRQSPQPGRELKDHPSLLSLPLIPKEINESMVSLPLKLKGRLVGVITLLSSKRKNFSREDLVLLGTLNQYISLGLKNALIFEQTRQMAMRDGLTNVYNHLYFQELLVLELARSERYQKPLSLAMIDIDHFKNINDSFGHQEGDFILKELVRMLQDSFRKTDIVARYGGEEFSIIFPETDSKNSLQLIEKLHKKINAHIFKGEMGRHRITVSSGLATFEPKNPVSGKILVARADQALYHSKHIGRNTCNVWKPK